MKIVPKSLEIRGHIARRGFNLKDFSEHAQISTSYLNLILNNHYYPSPKMAKKIADSLKVELEEVFHFIIEEDV